MKNAAIFIFLFVLMTFAFIVRSRNFFHGIQFDSDFGRDSLFALRILKGDILLLGPQASVGGFYLGPLYYYFVAAIYFVFGLYPQIVTFFFICMGVGAVLGGYWLLSYFISNRSGFYFLILSLTHPGLVMASRSATNQPMMPTTTIIFLYTHFKAIETQRYIWFLLSGITFGLFFHVHLSALLLLPTLFLLCFVQKTGRIRQKLVAIACITVGLVCMLLPNILFDVSHGFLTSKAFISYLTASAEGKALAENHPHYSLSEKVYRIFHFTVQDNFLFLLFFVSILFLSAIYVRKILKNPYIYSLATFALGSFLILLKYNGYLYDYYLLIPMTVILLFGATVFSFVRPVILSLSVCLFISLFHLSMLRYPSAFRTIDNLERITAEMKLDINKTNPSSFTVFKDSSDRLTGIGYEYRFLLEKDGFVPTYEQSYEQAQVLYYIQEEGNKDPLVSTNWETTQFGATKKQLLSTITFPERLIRIYKLTK